MDNITFLGVMAEHVETGNPYGSGILSKKELADRLRKARDELTRLRGLHRISACFIAAQNITCAETIYQCDRVAESACEFIEQVCDVVGYADGA